MTRTVPLELSVSGVDLGAIYRALAAHPLVALGTPDYLMTDGEKRPLGADWIENALSSRNSATARRGNDRMLAIDPSAVVKVIAPWDADVNALAGMLDALPITLASVRGIYPEWDVDSALKLPLKSLGHGHYGYGSFVAFKGKGHDRLVSRRWLEHGGPWLLHRGPDDLSVLQLHDLSWDARTAYEHVRRVQDFLGPADTGGLFQANFKRKLEHRLQHSERDRKATIVVEKREVTPREMLEAASLRGSDAAGPGKHIDAVAFLYMDPAQARRDLHELWKRGLEVWTYDKGREVRLDDTYTPPPPPKPW